jgi:hypothetical protein
MDVDTEKVFRKLGSMKEIREYGQTKPEIKEKWKESVEPVQSKVMSRFMHLKLKDEALQAINPVSDESIDTMKGQLRDMFPGLDTDKLQKAHTKNVEKYNDWKLKHCRESQYIFQIRKCKNSECCSPCQSEVDFLPDPILDDSGEHYQKYNIAKESEAKQAAEAITPVPEEQQSLEKNKSGIKLDSKKKDKQKHSATAEDHDPYLYTTQHARLVAICVECRKPRVVYSKNKLTVRQQANLQRDIDESDFTCGSPVTESILIHAKARPLGCNDPVEVCYYGSNLGQLDLCAHCGQSGGEVSQELKKKFKTVLPICELCAVVREIIVARPYGKQQ